MIIKTKKSVALILILSSITGCSAPENLTNEINSINSKSSVLHEGCVWEKAELEVFNQPSKSVKFRYARCSDPKFNSVYIESNGTKVSKLTFDIGNGSFSIFEQGSATQKEFVQSKIVKNSNHNGECKPKKIDENIWKISDGLKLNAEINFMPCGIYGRDFAEQKIFIFRDGVVINRHLTGANNDIDLSSIQYKNRE